MGSIGGQQPTSYLYLELSSQPVVLNMQLGDLGIYRASLNGAKQNSKEGAGPQEVQQLHLYMNCTIYCIKFILWKKLRVPI